MGARGAKSAKMDGGSACATADDIRRLWSSERAHFAREPRGGATRKNGGENDGTASFLLGLNHAPLTYSAKPSRRAW